MALERAEAEGEVVHPRGGEHAAGGREARAGAQLDESRPGSIP